MTELALFCSSFIAVFALGFQQKNVTGSHYMAAFFTSFAIGGSQIILWRVVPDASPAQIIAALCGGPFGIIAAMAIHPRIMRRKAQP
jgi:uncharacterized membrane protein YfcA